MTFQSFSQVYDKDSSCCDLFLYLEPEIKNNKDLDKIFRKWQIDFGCCYKKSKTVYIQGESLFLQKIELSKDSTEKQLYFDSLMSLFDKRIKYFGEEGFVLGKKGVLLRKYYLASQQKMTYETLSKSVNILKEKSDPYVLLTYLKSAYDNYRFNEVTKKELLDVFFTIESLIQTNNNESNNDFNIYLEIKKFIDNKRVELK
ncbi:MAG: hypothetical protein CVU05_13955 [Bacteroidetes bacterium HGW-Bacteroidetes-21]|jgi:hypothetical protein|nr:MAG: hypothetical protein CVU05_13955 [Bacteroidetes bacterium HGW-Bacteroidetes-21]